MRSCESQRIEQYLLNKQFQLNISNSYHNNNLNLEGTSCHGYQLAEQVVKIHVGIDVAIDGYGMVNPCQNGTISESKNQVGLPRDSRQLVKAFFGLQLNQIKVIH